jgi:hypothetical protein
MKFISKNWIWLLLVLVAVVIVYYMYAGKKKSIPAASSSNGTVICPTTAADWNQALADTKLAIQNDPAWLAQVQVQATAEGWTLDQALTNNAEFQLVNNVGVCKPA